MAIALHIAKLSLKPNDVVVVSVDLWLTKQQSDALVDTVKSAMKEAGHDNPVLILKHGTDLGIIDSDDIVNNTK
jgi:hypothetical protein